MRECVGSLGAVDDNIYQGFREMNTTKSLLAVALLLVQLAPRNVYAFTSSITIHRSSRPAQAANAAGRKQDVQLAADKFSFQLLSSSRVDTSKSSTENTEPRLRSRLRQVTGFSWTAFRATMRAATGISMTAVYASTLAFTGQWMRQTMKVILSIFPAWARYFVQPFLILYYLPLFTLRNLTGPNRRRGLDKPQALVDSWNAAVVTADSETLALLEEENDCNDL